MKNIILLILIIISETVFSNPKNDSILLKRINKIENDFVKKEVIEEKINNLKERIDNEEKLNERTLESISKQLDAASYNLTLFGILFGILAVGLGVYVTYVERKIVKIGEENKGLLSKNQKIKREVEDLNKLIQSDINGLYQKIKREETVNILDRLIKVPKDVANVCSALLSREMLPEDFIKLKQAYINVKRAGLSDQGEEDHENQYSQQYKILFFQHFLDQTMKDDLLRKDLKDYLYFGIQSTFENDIIKSTTDFTSAISELGIQKFSTEINNYFRGLSASEHKNYTDVYKIFFDSLLSRKDRFDLYSIVINEQTTEKAKIHYGKILKQAYENDNPTPSENLIFSEIDTLIRAEEAAELARKNEIENARTIQDQMRAAEEEQRRQAEGSNS